MTQTFLIQPELKDSLIPSAAAVDDPYVEMAVSLGLVILRDLCRKAGVKANTTSAHPAPSMLSWQPQNCFVAMWELWGPSLQGAMNLGANAKCKSMF